MKKNDVLDLQNEMPDEIDADELMYRLYLKQQFPELWPLWEGGPEFAKS